MLFNQELNRRAMSEDCSKHSPSALLHRIRLFFQFSFNTALPWLEDEQKNEKRSLRELPSIQLLQKLFHIE
jgi:hypothetical protein